MTNVAPGHATATLSGRELALQRRQAMARHGKTGTVKAVQTDKRSAAARLQLNAPQITGAHQDGASATSSASAAFTQPLAPKSAARARRQALSTVGKAALKNAGNGTASRPAAHLRPNRAALAEVRGSDCGGGGQCGCGHGAQHKEATQIETAQLGAPAVERVAPNAPEATGRALAKMRRAALNQDGKKGLKRVAQATRIAASMPAQDWQSAMLKGATGRQVAMQRRLVQSLAGRVDKISSVSTRPTGRVRARNVVEAPDKVEEGHTLSGQTVTGTQVERSVKVTGNEPGSCRAITGTEYIGFEQFQTLCGTRPEPAMPKVAVSSTLREQRITGTALGRSTKTTGDEHGACRPVTGTEYLSSERFEQFCSTRPSAPLGKVALTRTDKGQTVTGALVDRPRRVTGVEHGSDHAVTGTRYSQAETDDAPPKVAISHTAAGKPVTGTVVGRSERQTGDEAGSCRPITGTEYHTVEQFRDFCRTAPPGGSRKVSVMSTRDDQTVSGTAVDRSSKVTGNEVGSCRSITGSQYYTTADFAGLCKTPNPKKVAEMQTLRGRTVTGSEVAPSPKLSGDESYGCEPVTGTDYIGTRQLAAVCPAAPTVSPVSKVVVDTTLNGQTVTGIAAGRADHVTGNEAGACSPISGTPYIGQGQYAAFCQAPQRQQQAARVRESAVIPATIVTGDRPGAGGAQVTGDERGACEPISGTPYLGLDNIISGQCAMSDRFRTRDMDQRAPAPRDFSISIPARQAREERQTEVITGSGMSNSRITGPINKADGLITGTPEFRHGGQVRRSREDEPSLPAARRLSGEGSQQGRRVSGDAWDGDSRVTGTEGSSSLSRNPSMRGQSRGTGTSAMAFRSIERPEVPASVVTGSAGNTRSGATVTVSGGARG
jgi:hypothetical protein